MRVDPVGLRLGDPFYTDPVRWFGSNIYDLGHVMVRRQYKLKAASILIDVDLDGKNLSHNILHTDLTLPFGSWEWVFFFRLPRKKGEGIPSDCK
jgi:hypothetical protein